MSKFKKKSLRGSITPKSKITLGNKKEKKENNST